MTDVVVSGDTILITDPANMRLTGLHRAGRVLWTQRIEAPATRTAGRIAGIVSSGGIVLHSAGSYGSESDTVSRVYSQVYLLPRQGASRLIARVADLIMHRTETRYRGRVRYRATPVRFTSSARVVANGSTIFSTSGENYELELRSSTGQPNKRVRLRLPRRAVTETMRQADIEENIDRLRAPRGEPLIDPRESERLARTAAYADSLPAIHSLLWSPEGVVWIVDGIGPTDRGWTATGIRPDGSLVARLVSKHPGVPLAIERTRVIVREQDADEAAVLRVRSITP